MRMNRKVWSEGGGKNVEIIVTEIRIGFGNRRQCPEDHGRGLLNGCPLAQKSPGG